MMQSVAGIYSNCSIREINNNNNNNHQTDWFQSQQILPNTVFPTPSSSTNPLQVLLIILMFSSHSFCAAATTILNSQTKSVHPTHLSLSNGTLKMHILQQPSRPPGSKLQRLRFIYVTNGASWTIYLLAYKLVFWNFWPVRRFRRGTLWRTGTAGCSEPWSIAACGTAAQSRCCVVCSHHTQRKHHTNNKEQTALDRGSRSDQP